MTDLDILLAELQAQEKKLVFTSFTNEDALKIGMILIERAKREKKVIAINIECNNQLLFHYAFEGTTLDNEEWIRRKKATVYRFNISSYHMGVYLKKIDSTLEEKFYVDSFDYADHGGAFPVHVKNVGLIGVITVSGMAQQNDHEWVVSAIKELIS
jgi:uncharacterized protein (UPF0303 family)